MRSLLFLLPGWLLFSCTSHTRKGPENAQHNTIGVTAPDSITADPPILPMALSASPQVFRISTRKSRTITASKGLLVQIDTAALETMDGHPPGDSLTVTLRELTTTADMVANDCPTVSDGRLLISGGSYFIGITSNGSTLRLKRGKTIRVRFPKVADGMALFYGQRRADGLMNWKPMDKSLTNTPRLAETNREQQRNTGVITAAIPSRNRAESNALTGRFISSTAWLKAWDDSITAKRRAIVRKNFKQMTQADIRSVMLAPRKIAVADMRKMIRPRTIVRTTCFNGRIYQYKSDFEAFDCYFGDPDPKSDSVWYVLDTLKTLSGFAGRQSLPANISAPAETLNTIIDTATTLTAPSKQKGKFNVPGRVNVEVRYYAPVELDALGWINIDQFYRENIEMVPEFTLDIKGMPVKDIGIYIIFRNQQSVAAIKKYGITSQQLRIQEPLPLGKDVEFLVYSKWGKTFFQCKYSAKVIPGMVIPVIFRPVPDHLIRKVAESRS